MDRIRNKYNPEASQLKAEAAIRDVTEEQHKAWLTHPCTKALRYTIEQGLDALVLQWVKADFSQNTFEGTALINSRATGKSEGLENVLYCMDEMLENTQSEQNDYEDAIEDAINKASGITGNY